MTVLSCEGPSSISLASHLVVDLAAQDQRVGMFCLLAQDGFDLVEAFFVTLLIHENLGARVAN